MGTNFIQNIPDTYNIIYHFDDNEDPEYRIEIKNETHNWEKKIIQLQDLYRTKNKFGPVRDLDHTLDLLESLVISHNLVEADFIDLLIWDTLSLKKLYMLLLDPDITEIFGKLGTQILITTRVHGRVSTNLILDELTYSAIKRRCEIESGFTITPVTPSMKWSLHSSAFGNIRIDIHEPPLSSLPGSNIRRLPENIIDIETLISEDQITEEMAQYLIINLHERKNIVIAGEPGSGKTTLANAL